MDGCGHQRGGLGVGVNTNGGRFGVGIGRDGLSVVTDAKLDGGGCWLGGLGVGASPGTKMDGGLGPVMNSTWAESTRLPRAGSDPGGLVPTAYGGLVRALFDGLVPTVFDGLVPMVFDGLVPMVFDGWVPRVFDGLVPTVFDGLVPTVCDSLVPMACDSLVLAVDNGLVPTGCSAWAGGVRSVRASSDVLDQLRVVRVLQYSQMWHRMPELGGSAQWSTVRG
jgi:hypothetical protein